MRVAVIGAGAFGKEHISRLAARSGVELAIADPNVAAVTETATRFGIKRVSDDGKALIDRFSPDAVIIATPGKTHADYARYTLGAGVPTLLEKPIAMTAVEAEEICRLATESGVLLMPGHTLRFSTPHQRIVEIVRSGRIGRPHYIGSRRFRDLQHQRVYRDIDPVLMTMIHDIDLALWVSGKPASTASATRSERSAPGSLTTASVTDAKGIHWHLQSGWFHETGHVPPDRLEVVGSSGSADYEAGRGIRCFSPDGELVEASSEGDPLETELSCFLDAVANGDPSPVSPEDARDGLLAAEMIMNSLQQQMDAGPDDSSR